LKIQTVERIQMQDITQVVRDAVSRFKTKNGALMLFCPHTTCALTISEGADPAVARDVTRFLNERIPYENRWEHAEGNSDAHLKSALLGQSLLLPLVDGAVKLGTWQAIYLFDGDGPRTRSIWMSVLQEASEE